MESSRTIKSRYNSSIIRKILYIKVFNKIKIVKLFKELLFMAYKGKEKDILLVKI